MTVEAVQLPLGGSTRAERAALLVADLFALNVLFQVLDGVLTYQSLGLGFGEGNPLLASSMSVHGTGMALLLFKAQACGLLLLVRRNTSPMLGMRLLHGTALGLVLFAIVPWIGKLLAVAAINFSQM